MSPKLVVLLIAIALAFPAVAQQADLSIVGGGGLTAGDDQNTDAAAAVGVSFGFPYAGRHRIQFDYLFTDINDNIENRHFVTGSYVMQANRGRTRPFFQIGAGVVRRTYSSPFGFANETNFAGVFGGGATIYLQESLFLRPQVRVYAHVGPTLTVLPSIGLGYRF
jgi:hypothetical protein